MAAEKYRSVIQRILLTLLAMFAVIHEILCGVLDILAGSAETKSEEATLSAIRGGDLNYRTGKLDDGTDATGWYEEG
jgi:hypothetical protein